MVLKVLGLQSKDQGSNSGLATSISEIVYPLLPSRNMTEILLKRRKILKTTQPKKGYCIKSYPTLYIKVIEMFCYVYSCIFICYAQFYIYLLFSVFIYLFIILQTIESKLKVTLPDNLPETLRDGVLLCQLANSIRPRAVTSIHVPSPAVVSISDFIDILGHW